MAAVGSVLASKQPYVFTFGPMYVLYRYLDPLGLMLMQKLRHLSAVILQKSSARRPSNRILDGE